MFDLMGLKAWMIDRGISQTALAERLHCSRCTVNRILAGKRKPSKMLAERISALMDEDENIIRAVIPNEMESLLRQWAEEAHMSIQQLLDDLLSKLPKSGGC